MGISNGSRKIVGISLFIFWAAVTAILMAGLIFYQKDPSDNSIPVSPLPSGVGPIVLDSQEIGKHNLQSDCWMIIAGKVYNFTSYLGAHPGGAAPMLPFCGKDGSEAFATKDQKNPKSHSDYAKSLFTSYYLGDLDRRINQSQGLSQNQLPASSANTLSSTPAPRASPASSGANITLSAQEIAKHNSTKDCWLIINSKVYNVTAYLGAHPGGVGAIAPYCGKDGTAAFVGLPHSQNANSLLGGYYIGNLNQTTGVQQIQQNIQNTAQATPAPSQNEEDDD